MKLPRDLKGSDVVKALKRLGFQVMRQRGSHIILRRDSRTVVVPQHSPVKPGTLKSVIEQAGLSVDEFLERLR